MRIYMQCGSRTSGLLVFCFLLGALTGAYGQDEGRYVDTLRLEDYLALVLDHHPVAAQANLRPQMAQAELRKARGAFDPQLQVGLDEKEYKSQEYYRLLRGGLTVPTWFGATLSAGIEDNSGSFLNAENKVPLEGLLDAGIEVNVLQGLLVDERRTSLQKAKVYRELAANQQQLMINTLLLDALQAYFHWQAAVQVDGILANSIAIARDYFEFTKATFENGDKAAIDTVEAFLALQDQEIARMTNRTYVIETRMALENFLWYNGVPLQIEEDLAPEALIQDLLLFDQIDRPQDIVEDLPDIREKQLKLNIYDLERRLKADKLKPKLSLKYNFLVDRNDAFFEKISTSDYKWGIKFSVPLLLRSERADLATAKLKISEAEWDLENKRNELQNKLEASLAKIDVLYDQASLQDRAIDNASSLLNAEQTKFQIGESSVFLLNKRQEKYLGSQIKGVKARSKLVLSRLEYLYWSNLLQEYVRTIL